MGNPLSPLNHSMPPKPNVGKDARIGPRFTSLHDIGGHLCVQRGPRGIRTVVQSFNELLEIAAEEIPLDNKDLDALGRFFVAGEPRPRSVGPHFIAAAFSRMASRIQSDDVEVISSRTARRSMRFFRLGEMRTWRRSE